MATLEQIQAKLKKLQAQAEAMLAKKAQVAVDQIRALMLEHGLTTADIEAKAKATRVGKTPEGRASSGKVNVAQNVKTKAAPKYQHPATGATWSGRGRAPRWIAAAKDRTQFLTGGGADTAISTSGRAAKAKTAAGKSATASAGALGHKGQRKGPQPAMYRDPKSGATWSGRGRAPAWLGANRSKFLIDGGSAGAAEGNAPTTPSKPKVVRVVKAASQARAATTAPTKKVTAKKVTAKKVTAKKVAAVKKSVAAKVPAKKADVSKQGASAKKTAARSSVKKIAARKTARKDLATVDTPVATAEVVKTPEVLATEVSS